MDIFGGFEFKGSLLKVMGSWKSWVVNSFVAPSQSITLKMKEGAQNDQQRSFAEVKEMGFFI